MKFEGGTIKGEVDDLFRSIYIVLSCVVFVFRNSIFSVLCMLKICKVAFVMNAHPALKDFI